MKEISFQPQDFPIPEADITDTPTNQYKRILKFEKEMNR